MKTAERRFFNVVGKMNKIYLICGASAFVFGAYFYGFNIANSKCQNRQLQIDISEIQKIQQNKKEIHDTVYKTGTGDIRRILRDKYTIAE